MDTLKNEKINCDYVPFDRFETHPDDFDIVVLDMMDGGATVDSHGQGGITVFELITLAT